MDKRRMCPNCRAFITSDDKTCPYCEFEVGAKAVERRSPSDALGGLIPHARFTTIILLLINSGLYAATALYSMRASDSGSLLDVDGKTLFFFGAKLREAIFEGQWWRLITAGFLHGGVFHILMNSWVIFDLGATVEEFYGTSRYLVLYFLSTIAGFLLSTYWSAGLSVGASAALFGLIGAMIALGMQTQSSMGAAMKSHYTQWAIWGLVLNFLPGFRIDIAAHIGGLAAGFLAGYVMGTPRIIDDWREKIWQVAAGVCIGITLLAFSLMLRFLAQSSSL
ncbi:MAG: rhomboid family intramembrane serine protease [Bryobacteraceae bacterium]